MGIIIAAIFLLTGMFGCAESIEHDSNLASRRAVEFAEATFVRRNLDKGYALLADKARSYVPMEKFNEKVTKMHPNGHPSKVTAVNAVAVPGERIVNVRVTRPRQRRSIRLCSHTGWNRGNGLPSNYICRRTLVVTRCPAAKSSRSLASKRLRLFALLLIAY
jgi:hypothetical protein